MCWNPDYIRHDGSIFKVARIFSSPFLFRFSRHMIGIECLLYVGEKKLVPTHSKADNK